MSGADKLTRGDKRPLLERLAHRIYTWTIAPLASNDLARQRLKMMYYVWGYWRFFTSANLPLRTRVHLLCAFVRVDLNVRHGHTPSEIGRVCLAIAERRARPRESVVEAGCWMGGSSVKFSLLCHELGYRLEIFDSFEGVETLPEAERKLEWDYAGQYAAGEEILWSNLRKYGRPDVCSSHKGWFSETMARAPLPAPVRVAYIDCDLAKGTQQALAGIVPSLCENGVIFTQDFHIDPVRHLLLDPANWPSRPEVVRWGRRLASIRIPSEASR